MRRCSVQFCLYASVALASACTTAEAASFSHVATLDQPVLGILAADGIGNIYAESGAYNGSTSAVILLKAKSGYAVRPTLYTFTSGNAVLGTYPLGGVTLAKAMILGVTQQGGAAQGGTAFNLGTLSAITPTVLHNFDMDAQSDAYNPQSGLTAGPDNLYYGTSEQSGQYRSQYQDPGAVFQTGADPADPHYNVIHQFSPTGIGPSDGAYPTTGRVAVDAQGRVFGLTIGGGAYTIGGFGGGTVFMVQNLGGTWQEQVIFSFNGASGQLFPTEASNAILDAKGHIFACLGGGIYGLGGVVELSPPADGRVQWHEKTLVEFGVHAYDPDAYTACGITLDPATGAIVGVTDRGGPTDRGTLFTVSPPAAPDSTWSYAVDHYFAGSARDGMDPSAAPIKIGGAFYGSAQTVIWSYTP